MAKEGSHHLNPALTLAQIHAAALEDDDLAKDIVDQISERIVDFCTIDAQLRSRARKQPAKLSPRDRRMAAAAASLVEVRELVLRNGLEMPERPKPFARVGFRGVGGGKTAGSVDNGQNLDDDEGKSEDDHVDEDEWRETTTPVGRTRSPTAGSPRPRLRSRSTSVRSSARAQSIAASEGIMTLRA